MVEEVCGCHPSVPSQGWSCGNTGFGRMCREMQLTEGLWTSDALGRWDCPQPFQALLHPFPRRG